MEILIFSPLDIVILCHCTSIDNSHFMSDQTYKRACLVAQHQLNGLQPDANIEESLHFRLLVVNQNFVSSTFQPLQAYSPL